MTGRTCPGELNEAINKPYARLEIRVARIFNPYGPHMHHNDGCLMSNFVVQALKGETNRIDEEGQKTSFCYVNDLAERLPCLMDALADFTEPVHLGNPVESTIRELTEMTLKLSGSYSELVAGPLPSDDPKQCQPDIRLAKGRLGWAPSTTLEVGLARTIAYSRWGREEN